MNYPRLLMVSLCFVFCLGCGQIGGNPSTNQDFALGEYLAIHQSAEETIPIAVQMEQAFGSSTDHFITNYNISNNKIWNSEAYFNDRYMLTYQVKVKVDFNAKKVVPIESGVFVLSEVTNVKRFQDGHVEIHHGDSWNLSEGDWRTLFDSSKVDFSKVGINLSSNPTANFNLMLQELKKDRVDVTLLPDSTK